MATQPLMQKLCESRLATLLALFHHFTRGNRVFLLPLVLLLLLCGVLLLLTTGLSYVAPFVYAVF
jgi:hypothetical protein